MGKKITTEKKPRKIAICGTAHSSLFDINDLDRNEWEIWACNGCWNKEVKYDFHFELHSIPYLKGLKHENGSPAIAPEYFLWMQENKEKCILNPNGLPKEYKGCTEFPIEQLKERFGDYFTNTIAIMIAYAIMQKDPPTHISLFGVEMSTVEEYGDQRACCEAYLYLAAGCGVKITVPEVSSLLKSTHIYGLEEIPANLHTVIKDIKKAESQVDQMEKLQQHYKEQTIAARAVRKYAQDTRKKLSSLT